MAVCDSYDAMTSTRAYRNSRPPEVALDEVARESGVQFGPTAAEAFLWIPDEIFESLQAQRPEDVTEVPARVRTLHHIDPAVFAVSRRELSRRLRAGGLRVVAVPQSRRPSPS